jgi:hypothetical protein
MAKRYPSSGFPESPPASLTSACSTKLVDSLSTHWPSSWIDGCYALLCQHFTELNKNDYWLEHCQSLQLHKKQRFWTYIVIIRCKREVISKLVWTAEEDCATRTIEWLHCNLQNRNLVREGSPQKQDRKFQKSNILTGSIIQSQVPQGCSIPGHADWLTDRQS